MNSFEKEFLDSLKSNISLVDKIMHYIIKRKGKQIRPVFVFLSAKLFGEIKEKTYTAASMIELLHTATLIHDDVIDESYLRRGVFSINALWKNKIAVLVGDFLLSRGLLLSVKNHEFDLLKIMSSTVEKMSEGELLQMEKSRKININEDVYFEIIKKKTASLIAACCASGANSVNQNQKIVEQRRLFGENAGIAFQIKDDLFDYEKKMMTGKPVGLYIKEKKITLPLIHTLNNVDIKNKRKIINIIKNNSEEEEKVKEVIFLVNKYGGVEYAKKMMKKYHDKALTILQEFNDNDAKKSLVMLLDFIINRKK